MLDVAYLKSQIKEAISQTVIKGINRIEEARLPSSSSAGNEFAELLADTFDETVTDTLAELLANAIDSYVRNMNIHGWILTSGSPTTQTATINSPSPITNGTIPNTLKVD